MTQEEAKKRSEEKINQVLSLMATLRVKAIIKKVVTKDGFIEDTLFWTDTEKYLIDEETPANETRGLKQEVKEAEVVEQTNETQDEKIS